MDRLAERPILSILIIVLLCGYLFFFRLGGMALTDPDETFYAQTAKEMLARGEWVTPYLFGRPQFEKPIFFYWLVELSYRIFGVNEFAARLPSAVFGLIGVIAVYLLVRVIFNPRTGLLAGLMLAANAEYVILARACVTDMVLFTFLSCGALFFLCGHLKGRAVFYLLSSAAFGLATLTKGPVFLALPLAAIIIYLAVLKGLKILWYRKVQLTTENRCGNPPRQGMKSSLKAIFLKKIPLFWCAVVFLAVAAPWYLLIYKLHGKEFIDVFFGFHNVTRFLESEHKIGSEIYYNIPIILGGYFPWSVFLPFGLWHAFRKAQSSRAKPARRAGEASPKGTDNGQRTTNCLTFVLIWFFVIFGFFSVSSTKLPTYVFPSFLSLAIITASLWDDFLKRDPAAIAGTTRSYYLLPVIVALGSIGALIYIYIDYPAILAGTAISCIFLVFGFCLSLIAFINKRFTWALALIIYSLAIFLYPLSRLVLPVVERYETTKEVALRLKHHMKPGERIAGESNYLAGISFYTGEVPLDIDRHHALVQFLNSKDRVWCVLKDKNHRDLYDPKVSPDDVKPSYIVYRVGKRAIVTNEMPADGLYILKRERQR